LWKYTPAPFSGHPLLQSRLDLKAPGLEQGLGDVFGVLVAPGPLAEAGGADVLVGGELVLLDDELKAGDGGDDRADGLRLAPVWVAAALCHGEVPRYSGGG